MNVWEANAGRLDRLTRAYVDSDSSTGAFSFNETVRKLRWALRDNADLFTSEHLDSIIRKTLQNPRTTGITLQRFLTTEALAHPACSPETLRYACAYTGYFADVYHANAILNPNCPDDAKVYVFLNN